MKTSDSIVKLAAAMGIASNQIGAAVAGSENPFFKSKYADLGSVIKTFKEPMLAAGLSYIQLPVNDEFRIGVVTRLMHESGEWIEEEFTVPMVKQDPQSAGSCITYCRRYALASLFGIPTADSDAEAAMFRGDEPLFTKWQKMRFDEILSNEDGLGYACFSKEAGNAVMTALQGTFPTVKDVQEGQFAKSEGKQLCKTLDQDGWGQIKETVRLIQERIADNDPSALELTGELEGTEKRLVAGMLTDSEVVHLTKLKELAA